MTTINADYHRTRIEALYSELAALDGKVNQTVLGDTFDYVGARRAIMDQIEFHKKELAAIDDQGNFEVETQGY